MHHYALSRIGSVTLLLSIFIIAGPGSIRLTDATPVNIGLHASWPHTSTAAEATAWIAHHLGEYEVLSFLQAFADESAKHSGLDGNANTTIRQDVEQQLVKAAFFRQDPDHFTWYTLSWVLHARQYTPFVYLQYSLALDTLRTFSAPSLPHDIPEIFAVKIDPSGSKGSLLLQPSHLTSCEECLTVHAQSQDALSSALTLPRDVSLAGGCNFETPVPTTFLYAYLPSSKLAPWLEQVKDAAAKCKERFVLRFWDPARTGMSDTSFSDERPGLQGFIVRANMKSTEYKVIDDRVFSHQLFDDCPFGESDCQESQDSTDDKLSSVEGTSDETSTTYSGEHVFQYLKMQAEGGLEKALNALKTFTEDTPFVVASESFRETKVPTGNEGKAIQKAVRIFREKVGDDDQLFINGRFFSFDELTQGTEKLLHCLSVTGVSAMRLKTVTSESNGISSAGSTSSRLQGRGHERLRVNLKMGDSVGSALVWFNDLLKDSRYKKWKPLELQDETSIAEYVEEVQRSKQNAKNGDSNFVNVRAHHLSLVLLVDPGDVEQFVYTSIPEKIVHSDMPIRVGIVMVPNGRVSSLVAASFHYFLREKGRRTCARFLQMIGQVLQYFGGGFQQVPLSEQVVELAFNQIAAGISGGFSSASDVLENDDEVKSILGLAEEFAEKHDLFSEVEEDDPHKVEGVEKKFSLLGVLNGVVLKDISTDIINVAIDEQSRIANHFSKIGSGSTFEWDDSISEFEKWVASDPELIVVEGLSKDMRAGDRRLSRFKSKEDVVRLSAATVFALRHELRNLKYIEPSGDGKSHSNPNMIVWLAGKHRQGELFDSAKSVIEKLANSELAKRTNCRFAILNENSILHSKVLAAAGSSTSDTDVMIVINGRILPVSKLKALNSLEVEIASDYDESMDGATPADLRLLHSTFEKEVDAACMTSTHAASPGSKRPEYAKILEAIEASTLSNWTYTSAGMSLQEKESVPLSVVAIVNPLRQRAFMSSALLSALQEAYSYDTMSMTVVFSPTAAEMKKLFDPPSTYTKLLVGAKSNFHNANGHRVPERARFDSLSDKKVYTIAVEPPREWFVSSFATNYDMDNIVLGNLPDGLRELNAEYELQNLIVEGACIDEDESPPQGLKLVLRNEAGVMVDTIVMANLGYFQLKVPAPGRWSLHLAAGPSSKIFSLKTMEMFSGQIRTLYQADSTGRVPILVESLSGAGGILLRVERKPGMEEKSVLDEGSSKEAPSGVAAKLKARLSRLYSGKKGQLDSERVSESNIKTDKIHVFSVASGHLYERFLKIMMTSATKHASRPVKFWLLENYLSPSFKKFLPMFARKLGCEVGMVTYKWPGWLREQSEKQRIIWAYKILFLDVLFPLDVGRIIFVDSDQVLRGDLAELMDIDLEGAPYGYVPFCDSRKEVEGYRFWKHGFWKETLRGQRYRISALYVVDLIRFRETAAGDTLRFIYQSLSADPNSLSNLDQDLPNYASVSSLGGAQSVPIFDLPADWLWCESWCDDDSKKTAKAIDLCNNPMTKEPKLQSAKRIIGEWTEYDDAATSLTEEIYSDLVAERTDSHPKLNVSECRAEGRCTEAVPGEETVKQEL